MVRELSRGLRKADQRNREDLWRRLDLDCLAEALGKPEFNPDAVLWLWGGSDDQLGLRGGLQIPGNDIVEAVGRIIERTHADA